MVENLKRNWGPGNAAAAAAAGADGEDLTGVDVTIGQMKPPGSLIGMPPAEEEQGQA